jgi:hypothetical protein
VLLGELRKRNRRRILLDPASQVFNLRVVCHAYILWGYCHVTHYGTTVTVAVALA